MDNNLLYYITGWNLFKENITCCDCILNYINNTNISNETSIFTHIKSYGKIFHQTDALFQFFLCINNIIDSYNLLQKVDDIEHELLAKCIDCNFYKILYCNCDQHLNNMIKRFIRLKLHTFARQLSSIK